ncbi:transcriptional regulator with XRE-family HTH domain [Mesorhizobium robiniae]|uniref:Transcriptional regulator with XRE-family HTH domain n=1 Tax=Mesorhizobium robiniae TaxID=559315 RepID=A0ABV2GZ80_9HYPH|nr:helix-turn-helix transcriptional regulator [Mesorhizobium sp. ZC-5]MCV3243574.1 helix-turn-helix transcriptional regulator [Mesorhizobium sp. ZC-5]
MIANLQLSDILLLMSVIEFNPIEIATQIDSERRKRKLSCADLARQSGVHVSQVSRVCRGRFRTVSQNTMRICNALGLAVNPDSSASCQHGRLLAEAIIAVWDKTPSDAQRLLRFIESVAALRESTHGHSDQ